MSLLLLVANPSKAPTFSTVFPSAISFAFCSIFEKRSAAIACVRPSSAFTTVSLAFFACSFALLAAPIMPPIIRPTPAPIPVPIPGKMLPIAAPAAAPATAPERGDFDLRAAPPKPIAAPASGLN